MREFKFPLHFQEIPVGYSEGFTFALPEKELDRDDINIWVEYFKREDNPEILHFGVWANIGDIQFRRLVLQGDIPNLNNRDKQVDQIFSIINLSEELYENIRIFAGMVDLAEETADFLDE